MIILKSISVSSFQYRSLLDCAGHFYTIQSLFSISFHHGGIMYFDRPGRNNTEKTLSLAFERGKTLGLNEVVVASSGGSTAYAAIEIFKGFNVIVVTTHCGWNKPFEPVMSAEVKTDLEKKGATVVTASHALSGIERSLLIKHSGVYPVLIMADTLRLFGQGMKVVVEIAVMASDAGSLSGSDIVSIGGTGDGADTAVILKPAHQHTFFDMRIREIICKPRKF
jgi:hypothetical protein